MSSSHLLLYASLYIVIGFGILIFAGDALVKGSVSLAARLSISPAIIGLTIIAAGTSAPEAVTSFIAAQTGSGDIAFGNVLGSNIFNLMAILGITSWIRPLHIEKPLLKFELPLLIFCTSIIVALCWDGEFSRVKGLLCLFGLTGLLYVSFIRSKKVGFSTEEDIQQLKNVGLDLLYIAGGLIGLIYGAKIALHGGVSFGKIFGLSDRIIAITIISVGTSLPELITSIVASYRGRNDIAVANVIGSNLMNTMGVTGIATIASPLQISREIAHSDNLILLCLTLLFLPLALLKKGEITRPMGALLIFIYIGYVISIL